MKKLPIGISTLSRIINEGYAYVDKTRKVHQLVETGSYFFLSRPRRFGKSLFIDTLKEAFEGNRDLFRGLWLHDHWNWDERHPVIHLAFAEGVMKSRDELNGKISTLLEDNEKRLRIESRYEDIISSRFGHLIRSAHEKYNDPM